MKSSIPASQFVVGSLVMTYYVPNDPRVIAGIDRKELGIIIEADPDMSCQSRFFDSWVRLFTVVINGEDHWVSIENMALIARSPDEA